jgi:hypothetical protein
MKKLFIFCLSFQLFSSFIQAKEGMWLPLLVAQLNEKDMQSLGMKITAKDLYAENQSSLKDAIVHFGGGCTGEIISKEGLLITNHHCGYGQIQQHSSVENDLLTKGFWANKKQDELKCEGLFVTFIVRMEDVTQQIFQGIKEGMSQNQKDSIINLNSNNIKKQATQGTHYEAIIKPFYYGNEYFMFITEKFDDVRLVGAPPSSIGKFGADTDNWMWPRHTGDFALFRIYAGKDNKPNKIDNANLPYIPKKSLKVSLKGVSQGDFTMVYGFPGRTQEYLPSSAIDYTVNHLNPARINVRSKRLSIWNEMMLQSDKIRIQYSAKYASLANAYKKWIGENMGIKKLNGIEKKKANEIQLLAYLKQASNANFNKEIFNVFENHYQQMKSATPAVIYTQEAIMGIEVLRIASSYQAIVDLLDKGKIKEADERLEKMKKNVSVSLKNYSKEVDQKIAPAMFKLYSDNVSQRYWPQYFTDQLKKNKSDLTKLSEQLHAKSNFSEEAKIVQLLKGKVEKVAKKIKSDPAYIIYQAFNNQFLAIYKESYQPHADAIEVLMEQYMAMQKALMKDKTFYPDANSTLRISYGKVEGYHPYDGAFYTHFTTSQGILEKEDNTNYEFVVHPKLKDLILKKDFGNYAKNDTLFTCFVASNHTTGGNSGSPVLDAYGNLIGVNFDRTWEGTMSDLMYDVTQCRNIALDIRYALFVIDKFAGAKHLVNEMELVQ